MASVVNLIIIQKYQYQLLKR